MIARREVKRGLVFKDKFFFFEIDKKSWKIASGFLVGFSYVAEDIYKALIIIYVVDEVILAK